MSLADEMQKAFGGATKTKAQTAKFFSTGYPPLDKIISGSYQGGIPQGRLCEIFGPSAAGKTHLVCEILKSAQQHGGYTMLCDFERRWRNDFAERRGLDPNPPKFVHITPETWEAGNASAIKFAEMIRASDEVASDAPIVIAFDSVAAAIPSSVLYDKNKSGDATYDRAKSLELNMADNMALARATSSTLKIIAHYANALNATFIYVNQVRTAPNVIYGDPTTVPGGKSLEFYCDLRLQLSRSIEKEGKDAVGQTVKARTVKNAVTRPFQETAWTLEFKPDGDTVLNKAMSLIDHMADAGLIESPSKGWVTNPVDGSKVRKKELIDLATNNEAFYDAMLALLK